MAVPDILYDRELAAHNGPYLKTLGLGVVSLTPAEVQLAQSVSTARRRCPWPDAFALSCAMRPEHTLVTGDKTLRAEAAARHVSVVGLLWLLDHMADVGVSKEQLREGLSRICAHVRCRLPAAEVKERFASW